MTDNNESLTHEQLVGRAVHDELKKIFSKCKDIELTGGYGIRNKKTRHERDFSVGRRMITSRYYQVCNAALPKRVNVDLIHPNSIQTIAEIIIYCLSRTKINGCRKECPASKVGI